MDDEHELHTWLAAIGTLTSAVNSGRGLREVLNLIASTARQLLGLDFCGVLVPDAGETALVIAGWSGLSDTYVARVNSDHPVRLETDAHSGAPSSRAYRSGRPAAVSDISLEPGFIWGGVAHDQDYRSMLSVPLVTASGVIGTLNSYRSAVHEFDAEETGRLQLLAEHAAIAITSARLVENLREQHELVTRSERIHERLLRVAVRAGGMSGIAAALHDLLDTPVVLQDARGEVLAAAGPPADPPGGGWTPAAPGGELVREQDGHVVADVVLSGEVPARVWLPRHPGPLSPVDRRALEHASVVLSLELLRRRTALEVEQNLRGELLAELLAGADPRAEAVRHRARLLGHDLTRPHRALVGRIDPTGRGSATQARRRATDEANRLASTITPRPLVAQHRDAVVALWPLPATGPEAAESLRRALSAAVGVASATVAVSEPTDHEFAEAYRTAKGALAVAGPGGGVVTLDGLGVAGLLLRLDDPEPLHRYAERTLGPLLRHDEQHGTALVATLRAHLTHHLDRQATAQALLVHPNTISQRLRRIETLTQLDLRNPSAAVEARSALTVLDVARGLSRRPPQPG
ncbi:helix-turn-helix domain-containing protein [Amycolatopsis eburnea]|uniref:GAF domain-containing protein n=1 Tax=Amycolatopsis eburnea TaxID=2267691 RepID=A0A3R9FIM5_9PSEU|nr:GAF domain-containing protein [Amycolatopsis eburnea]RSD11834.1 GAF domain-containing protein [Amycolatopsis eburnea]